MKKRSRKRKRNSEINSSIRIKLPHFDIERTSLDPYECNWSVFDVFDDIFDVLWNSDKREDDKMGKKKKNKKHTAKSNIRILNSGKLKVKGGQKLDLNPFIKDSIDESVVSRLDAIISKERVDIDSEGRVPTAVSCTLVDELSTAEIASRMNDVDIPTVVIPILKKNAIDVFNYLHDGALGDILRSSTLAAVYSQVKSDWVDLNEDDKSGFTNVLFVPNVLVFINNSGELRKKPFKINVCIVALPTAAKMEKSADTTEVTDKITDEDVAARIIVDIVESAIKCGGTRVIVNPFSMKPLMKDVGTTAELWNQIITSERALSQIKSIDFSIEDEDLYIVFNAKRH